MLSSCYFLTTVIPASSAVLSLLSLPPAFIPTPSDCNHRAAFGYLVDFIRKFQWRSFWRFSNAPFTASCRFGLLTSSRWPPAAGVSSSVLSLSRKILSAGRSLLFSDHTCFSSHNLPPALFEALTTIQANDSVIVRPSDKGGRWVLMDAQLYRQESLRLLGDAAYYRPLETPVSPTILPRLDEILHELLSDGFINRREFLFLSSVSPRSRRFNILPKIHKTTWPHFCMAPGRPIVSDVNTESSNVARFIDFFLLPLVFQLDSFLLDSGHFLARLQPISILPHSLLCTLDVRSLYTNVPIEQGLQRVSRAFQRFPDASRPDRLLLELLHLCLNNNDFLFENTWWIQTSGVAMGKAFGGAFANLYLGEWEHDALASSPLQPTAWLRFQDDIFFLWDHGLPSLNLFVSHLNQQDPRMQVDLFQNANTVRFLDLELYRSSGSSHHLGFRVGFKQSHSFSVLPASSHHAPHVHRAVIFSQILRWATRSSSRDDFSSVCHHVFPHWRAQSVTRSLIRTSLNKVIKLTGLIPIWQPGFSPCDSSSCGTCRFASPTFSFSSPHSNIVFRIPFRLSCSSLRCIYFISCSRCSAFYVGLTTNILRTRINQHLRSIRDPSSTTPVALHFRSLCSLHHFRFFAFDRSLSSKALQTKETRWIKRLKASLHPGLNTATNPTGPLNLVTFPGNCTTKLNTLVRHLCSTAGFGDVRLSYKTDPNLSSLLR